ncbi:hypothetical protein EVAR_52188_1 [Eumeta japonica]|uniref:Uncharacterized protein n=1 Tax=Eumeta variegata TaxID=151549 RepID=A0A4C1Z1G7_EUMVA|nr:hypothetical protein EVAR_52188_1 [Eumeta japonica]
MSNYERTGHTVVRYRSVLQTLPTLRPINIPPLTNMEATGCRLAMTGHSTLVIVSVYLPSPKQLLRRDLRALFALGDAVILFGALTNHVRTVVEESERGSGILGSPEVSARYSRIDKSKNAALRRASAYPTPEYRSRARALQREVKARVREFEMRVGATSWRKSNHPTKRFGQLPKRSKPRIYPIPHSKPDNSVAIDDAEIAECLADSIETQCSHASLRTTSLISVASRKRFSKNPRTQRRSGSRLTQRSPNASEIT